MNQKSIDDVGVATTNSSSFRTHLAATEFFDHATDGWSNYPFVQDMVEAVADVSMGIEIMDLVFDGVSAEKRTFV